MKKLALTALAAAIATIGLASAATADSRYDDDEWPRHSRDGGDWDGRRDGDRHARRDHDDDEWRWRDRRDHWRHHHHRPHIVFRRHYSDDYCFVKKIRLYDDWGNMYIKRVRVCR